MKNQYKYIQSLFQKAKSKLIGTGSSAEIFSNMGKLATGVGLAKIIAFLTMPLITRIYTPEDFGILSVFAAAITLAIPFVSLRYPITIPLPKSDGLAFNIVALCTILIVVTSGFATILLLVLGDEIFILLNMNELSSYWWLLTIGIIVAAFYEMLSYWGTRAKAFSVVARTKVVQAISASFIKIVLGLVGWRPAGLLFGEVAKQGGGITSLLKYFYRSFKGNIHQVSLQRILFLGKYYADLPKFRLPSQVLLKLSAEAPILYFAYQFGQETTGQLGLALSVVALPMALLGNSTGQAYFAEIAKIGKNNRKEILKITKQVTKKLFVLSLLPCLILIVFAPSLFTIFFGNEWSIAGIFTSILAFYLLLQFISTPLVNTFTVLNRQEKFLEINTIRFTLTASSFIISFYLNLTAYYTLLIYTIFLSIHYLITVFQVYNIIRKD